MDPLLWSGLTALASVVTTTVAVYGWLSTRFHSIQATHIQLKEKLEHYEYLINSNTELINHRTNRFTISKQEILNEIKSLEARFNGHHEHDLRTHKDLTHNIEAIAGDLLTHDGALRVLIHELDNSSALAVLNK